MGTREVRGTYEFLRLVEGRSAVRDFVWVRAVSDFIFEITFEIEELIVSCVHRRIAVNIIEGG
jgi:hypothetical protein